MFTNPWWLTICALLSLTSITHEIYIADRYQGFGEFYREPLKLSAMVKNDMKYAGSAKFGNDNGRSVASKLYQSLKLEKNEGPQIRVLTHKLPPAMWSLNIIQDKTSDITSLAEAEPGFDFSDEEMRKLKIWPGGVIPYYIDEFSFDKVFRDRIRTFLEATNSVTGLNFLELHRPPDDDKSRWVMFINRRGLLSCADHPFKNFTNEGVQRIILGYDCLATCGELAEVVLALVGVPPQHNAPDREKHVQIVKKNIVPGKAYLFEKLQDNEWLFHDMNYDFSSASHYPLHKYTVNGMATIKPLGDIDVAVGEGKGFSFTDIWKIRMLYNYISKKRLKSINLPECKKLFNVGANISNIEPYSDDDIQPRKKPNKYLGLSKDNAESPDPTPNVESKGSNSDEGEKLKKKDQLKSNKYRALQDLSDYETNDEYESKNTNQKQSRFGQIGR